MTDQELLDQQENLQKEGKRVLDTLDLVKTLKKHGEIEIVGSFDSGLMVHRDIDIEVFVDEISPQDSAEIASELIMLDEKRIDVTYFNNVDLFKPELAKGIYLGIRFYPNWHDVKFQDARDDAWKMDVWFVGKKYRTGRDTKELLKKHLSEKRKLTILRIKNEIKDELGSKKMYSSFDVYIAVLKHGVTDFKGFEKYLKDKD